jgi:predicted NUDIX family phosphoesterase
MGHFLDIAYRVLQNQRKSLSAVEITQRGLASGWLKTTGQTPSQTMKSKLSTDILKKKDRSLFMRTDQGLFTLREFSCNNENEFIADRYQKALFDEIISVFPKSSLKKYIPYPGFHVDPLENGGDLLSECIPMSRLEAEKNFQVIQLVSVFIVKYRDRYLTYKRAKRLPESRLHDFYSVSFGGHVNYQETKLLFNIFDPQHSGILARELMEELRLDSYKTDSIIYKGLLYDDSKEISTQHLGIVYDVILDSDKFEIGERGFLVDPKFETLDMISNRIEDFENWSVLLVDYEIRNKQ